MTRIPETKDDLKRKIQELQEDIERLENDVDYWETEYKDAQGEIEKLEEQIDNLDEYNGIKDLDNFIWKLKLDNLYTEELEKFINEYMKYYNN